MNNGRKMLRVGMTGHIALDPAKMEQLEQGIERAIGRIESAFPDRRLTAFSSLAIGADRLVTRKILERRGSRLIAVLPMPAEEYEKDFGPSDSRQEFRDWLADRAMETIIMPPSATRDEAYEKAGYYVARNCDVMIAVYDGKESQGRGGTADVVKEVQRLGRPLCHVWAGNYKDEPAKRTEIGPEHDTGDVSFFNFNGLPHENEDRT